MYGRLARRALLPAAALLLTGGLTGTAHAAPGCGDEVTGDVTLTADLVCGGTDGLIVTAQQHLVIDLKGHTISGSGPAGIRVRTGSHHIEVRNGSITGFSEQVLLDQSDHNRVWNLTLTGGGKGVNLANASGNLVEKNRISGGTSDAIRFGGTSDDNLVRQNTLSGSVFGIHVADFGSRNTVTQNAVSGMPTFGIALSSTGTDNVVSRNQAWGNEDGIEVSGTATGTGNVVSQNKVWDNWVDGIRVDAPAAPLVSRNTATDNGRYGIYAPTAVDGGGNTAYGNGAAAQCVGVACAAG